MKQTDIKAYVISDEQAEYELSWAAQIEALTAPGLTDEERVRRFVEAAELKIPVFIYIRILHDGSRSAAVSVWSSPNDPKSLFANLPGCKCPVIEQLEGVPHTLPSDWHPTADQLRVFAHHQRQARFGNA